MPSRRTPSRLTLDLICDHILSSVVALVAGPLSGAAVLPALAHSDVPVNSEVTMIKRLLLLASTNKRLEKLVSTNKLTRALVSRYVAGTTLHEAIVVTQELQAVNIDVSLDLLGET